MSSTLAPVPAQLKAVQAYMRIAQDIERIDPVVAYWMRLYSTELSLKIDKESTESKVFLGSLIKWLEDFKTKFKDNEAVSNETVGQAHFENFVVALFNKADTSDRDGKADKNTVRMFFMAALMFESMAVFGEITEEVSKKAKYAKFKAAYIQKCLKSGIQPKPGPVDSSDLDVDSQQKTSRNEAESAHNINSQPVDGNKTPASASVLDIPEVPQDTDPDENKPDQYIMTPSAINPLRPVKPANFPTSSTAALSDSSTSTDYRQGSINATKFQATNGAPLNPEDILKSQKYCKFANSALQYDDVPTAVANLEKALRLLKTGKE